MLRQIPITLDLSKVGDQTTVTGIRQNDSDSIQFVIRLVNGSEPFDVDPNFFVAVYGIKPDGKIICNYADIIEGKVYYTLTTQNTVLAGTIVWQLKVGKVIDSKSIILGSPRFSSVIEPSEVNPEDVTSSDEFALFIQAIDDVESGFSNVINIALGNPDLRNGTVGNIYNQNGISVKKVQDSREARGVWISTKIPLPSGYKYMFVYRLYTTYGDETNDNTHYISGSEKTIYTSESNLYIKFTEQTKGFSVCLLIVSDDRSTYYPLRVTTTGNALNCVYDYVNEELDELINADLLDVKKAGNYVSFTPKLRNGTVGNSSNPNGVSFTKSLNSQGAFGCWVTPEISLPSGYEYMFIYRLYTTYGDETYDNTHYISGSEKTIYTSESNLYIKFTEQTKGFSVCLLIVSDDRSTYYPLRVTTTGNALNCVFDYVNENLRNIIDSSSMTNDIILKNIDIRKMVDASCYYGHNGQGVANYNKQFSLLVTTDVHGDSTRFNSAVNYLNGVDSIDAGICLGDMAESNWSSSFEWYKNAVLRSQKPWYTVIGNHDGGNSASASISARVSDVFSRWIEPTLSKIGDTSINKTYYSIKNTTHKIELIVLNVHDVPDTLLGQDFAVSRGAIAFSQAQIDWFINELNNIPSDYTLLVALHYLPNDISLDSGLWTNITAEAPYSSDNCYQDLIPDINKDWKNGASLNSSYKKSSGSSRYDDYLPIISVNVNFSARGRGKFACYLAGHTHQDIMGHATKYADQKYICFDTTANDLWQNYWSDLPRTVGEKTEDCITIVSVDTTCKEIRLVRVGSNFTTTMSKREYFSIKYESEAE